MQVYGIPVSPKIGNATALDKSKQRRMLRLPHELPKTKIVLATLTSESLDDCNLAWLHVVRWALDNPNHFVVLIARGLARERLKKAEAQLQLERQAGIASSLRSRRGVMQTVSAPLPRLGERGRASQPIPDSASGTIRNWGR